MRQVHASLVERVTLTAVFIGIAGVTAWQLVSATAQLNVVFSAVLTVLAALGAVNAWRWRIVVDEDGLWLRPGFGSPRRVRWAQIKNIDDLPQPGWDQLPELRLRSGERLRFNGVTAPPLNRRNVQRLREAIEACRPQGAGAEGERDPDRD